MVKRGEIPRTTPAKIENLIQQVRAANLEPAAKEKIERLLRTALMLLELHQRKRSNIAKKRDPCSTNRSKI